MKLSCHYRIDKPLKRPPHRLRCIQVGRPILKMSEHLFYPTCFQYFSILVYTSSWGFIITAFSIQNKTALNKDIFPYSYWQVDEIVDCEYSVPVSIMYVLLIMFQNSYYKLLCMDMYKICTYGKFRGKCRVNVPPSAVWACSPE